MNLIKVPRDLMEHAVVPVLRKLLHTQDLFDLPCWKVGKEQGTVNIREPPGRVRLIGDVAAQVAKDLKAI